jgi:hypothetical protein
MRRRQLPMAKDEMNAEEGENNIALASKIALHPTK